MNLQHSKCNFICTLNGNSKQDLMIFVTEKQRALG